MSVASINNETSNSTSESVQLLKDKKLTELLGSTFMKLKIDEEQGRNERTGSVISMLSVSENDEILSFMNL